MRQNPHTLHQYELMKVCDILSCLKDNQQGSMLQLENQKHPFPVLEPFH